MSATWIDDIGQTLTEVEAECERAAALRKLDEAISRCAALRRLRPTAETADTAPQVQFIAAGYNLLRDAWRGSGCTESAILSAISRALMYSDLWITFDDPTSPPRGKDTLELTAEVVRQTAKLLALTIDVEVRGSVIRVRSPLSRICVREPLPE